MQISLYPIVPLRKWVFKLHVQKDIFNQIELPEIYIAQNNKDLIGCLYPIENLKIDRKLNDINTISFTMYRQNNGIRHPYYDDITELKLIFVPGYDWYQISVATHPSGNNEYKEITGRSLEVELQQITLIDFEINSGDMDYEEYDEFDPIVFCDATDPAHSMLHLVISHAPSWSIGHVDEKLTIKQRSFDITQTDIYSFLTQDAANAFECFFLFDSFNRTVSAYIIEDYGYDTTIFCDFENLLQQVEINVDDSQIKTLFRVYGGENLQVEEVNPSGTNKIINVGYYLRDMTVLTQNCYLAYEKKLKEIEPEFIAIMTEMQGYELQKYDLLQKSPATANSTNWSEYGLNKLKAKEKTYLDLENHYIQIGIGNAPSIEYLPVYLPNHNLLLGVRAEITLREKEIKQMEDKQMRADKRRAALNDSVAISQFFTEDTWREFQLYLREGRYENGNFITTTLDTDGERIKTTQELLEYAQRELSRICHPNYSISTSMCNLLTIPAFDQLVLKDFALGNYIRLGINEDYIVRLRLISIGLDFSNLENITVEFSDLLKDSDVISDFQSIINQAVSSANTVENNQEFWKKGGEQGNWVWDMRKNGLDAAQVTITAAKNQSQVIDEYGTLLRLWNEEKRDYELEQAKLINNLFAFTDDGWKSVKLALGKIHIVNPNSGVESHCYGLVADVLIGKMIVSESTYIGNNENTFTIDERGLLAYSKDRNTVVKIDPNNTNGLLEIWKNYQKSNKYKTFWTDDKGNLSIIGNFSADELYGGKIVAQKGNNKVVIDPGSPYGLLQVLNGDKLQIYFNTEGDAVFEGKMTVGAIYSKNWLTSGGSPSGNPKGMAGTYINLFDGTFTFSNDRLTLDETGLSSKDPLDKDLFTKLAGASLISQGKYQKGWMNDSSIIGKPTHTTIQNGRIELKNEDNSRDLFILSEGISTTVNGSDTSTGIIDFYSKVYGEKLFGVTVQTSSSPVALRSLNGYVILNPHVTNANNNMFVFGVDSDSKDGLLHFGNYNPWLSKSSIRFCSSENKIQVQNLNATGSITVNNVEVATKKEVNELKAKIDGLILDRNRWKDDAEAMHRNWDGHVCYVPPSI